MKNHYELVYIIPVKTDDDDTTPVIALISQAIQDNHGDVIRTEDWGKRKLAYTIKNVQYGHYILNVVDFEPQDVEALDDKLATVREILRYQIVKVDSTELPKKIVEKEVEGDETKKPVRDIDDVEEETKEIKKKAPRQKVSMEELDKKIEEILKV
ncbi:MAG: 30S ribosomal protein S6 [Patescibacteria group bacterium]